MRTLIEVSCVDQVLEFVSEPLISSGGFHENFVRFSFCPMWDGFVKTAVFYNNVKNPYYVMLDENNECEVPHEVTDSAGYMYFGVFGVLGDVTRTSKLLRYQIKQGAIANNSEPYPPTPDVWEQLLSAYNEILSEIKESNQSQDDFINEANEKIDEIMQNGGGLTMSYSDYQALSTEEKMNGATYYVPDAPGGGGGSSVVVDPTLTVEGQAADAKAVGDAIGTINMYYDPATDIKYLKNQEGEWVESGTGGLLWDGSLYREGNTYSDITGGFSLYQVAGTGGGSYSLVFNTNNLTVTSNSSLGILSTNNKIDFSKYTKLHIEGTLTHTDGDSVVFTVGFSTSKNATDTSVYSFEIGKTTKTIAETIDISTHNSGPLYIHINFYAHYNYKWVGNFVLNNLYFLP